MAWLRAWRLRSCLPPSGMGCWKVCRLISGAGESSFRNFCICFMRACSISVGMPCTRVRYCVSPPITMPAMRRLLSYVGWLLLHCQKVASTLSRMGDQTPSCPTALPMKAPSARMGSVRTFLFILYLILLLSYLIILFGYIRD